MRSRARLIALVASGLLLVGALLWYRHEDAVADRGHGVLTSPTTLDLYGGDGKADHRLSLALGATAVVLGALSVVRRRRSQ